MRKVIQISLLFLFAICFTGYIYAQEAGDEIVKGVIEEVAQDGSYIIVNKQKINTAKDFVDEAYFEVGDKVKIEVKSSAQGLEAVDYEYIFDEEAVMENEGVVPDENYDSDYAE